MLKYKLIFIILSYSFCFFVSQANALPSFSYEAPFTIRNYGISQGLPQNEIISLERTKNNTFLVLTSNGIVEFDGIRFHEINLDKDYLSKKLVQIQKINSKKIIGLNHVGELLELNPKLKKLHDNVDRFILDNGQLFLILKSGDILKSSLSTMNFVKIGKISLNKIKSSCIFDNRIYIASIDGLTIFDLKENREILPKQGLLNCPKVKIINNEVYFLSFKGINKIQGDSIIKIQDLDPNIYATDFAKIGTKFYVTSRNGLQVFNKNKNPVYGLESGFKNKFLKCIYYDDNMDCFFVGSNTNRLYQLTFKKFSYISGPRGLKENSFSSLIKLRDKIYSASNQNVIFSIDPKKLEGNYFLNKNQSSLYYASLSNIDNELYAGTWRQGLSIFTGPNLRVSNEYENILSRVTVFGVFKDSKGRLLVGTSAGLAYGESIDNLKFHSTIKDFVITIYELQNGSICLGTTEGLNILTSDFKDSLSFNRKNGFKGTEVRSFYEDDKNRLWFGSYNGGLYCLDHGKVTNINGLDNNKLPADIFTIVEDENGFFYFSGNKGLFAINKNKLYDYYEGKLNSLIPYYFGVEYGINNIEFNGAFLNNYLKYKDQIFFPTIEGVTSFLTSKIKKQNNDLIINGIYVDDSLYLNKKMVFPRETSKLTFDLSASQFQKSNLVYYQYKLDKNNQAGEWSNFIDIGPLTFNELHHGEYTLHLRKVDSKNESAPRIISYPFKILPYFYETYYFLFLAALLLILVTFLIVFSSSKKKQRIQREEMRLNNQISELKLAAIQSQMNPHFVFNFLNNFKYLIIKNKLVEAEHFIDEFSLLLRKFLEYSDCNFVTINKEVEIIDSYLKLERQRVQNKFNYRIYIDDGLSNQKIPTILLQPFVENAIKHGVSQVKYSGIINIELRKEKNHLILLIEDNGIGFDTSLSKRKSIHEAKGIQLVKDKINNLKLNYNINVSLEVIDKKEINESGTKIILKINLNEMRNY